MQNDIEEMGLNLPRVGKGNNKALGMNGALDGHCPNGWTKPGQLAWLDKHPISSMGDENTTRDADCQSILVVLAQTKLLKIASLADADAHRTGDQKTISLTGPPLAQVFGSLIVIM